MQLLNQADFVSHVLRAYPQEACGLVINGSFLPCENRAADPLTSFEIAPGLIAEYFEEIECIVHSHTQPLERGVEFDPRCPSKEDLEGQIATALPWAIVSCDGKLVSEPVIWGDPNNRPALEGREFVFNVQDCFSLATDYFYAKHEIHLEAVPRDWDWQSDGENLIELRFRSLGFEEVPLADARPSDALLFAYRSSVVNHIGIYTGDNQFLHHELNRLSRTEHLTRMHRWLKLVVRHKDLM